MVRYPFLQEASWSHTLASGLSLPALCFQTKTFLSSPKEYTARVLCLRELNFYSYLQQSLDITTFSSLEIPSMIYQAIAAGNPVSVVATAQPPTQSQVVFL